MKIRNVDSVERIDCYIVSERWSGLRRKDQSIKDQRDRIRKWESLIEGIQMIDDEIRNLFIFC